MQQIDPAATVGSAAAVTSQWAAPTPCAASRQATPGGGRNEEWNTPMPTKRAVLGELTAEELRANVDYYELEVADRRVKAQLVDALAGIAQYPVG